MLQEFADIATKVQAQNALAKTMVEMRLVVDILAMRLIDYADAQERIIDSLQRLERTLAREAAGPNRMAWYV